MNSRRITFWTVFIVVLGLIVVGLIAAMNKPAKDTLSSLKEPAPITSEDHVYGPSDAPVTLIEYSDFQCPACEMYFYEIEQLLASSTVPIRFVYRQFPLAQHPNAVPAALASEAAGAQGKFWDMYKLIFANHTEWTELPDAVPTFVKYAETIGLDIPKFKADMAPSTSSGQGNSTLIDKITNSSKEGVSIGINATPTFFVNGKPINNPPSYAEFETLIETAAVGGAK